MKRTTPFIAAAALLLTPLAAQAQVTVIVTGTVDEQCALGAPDLVVLDLGDLTGPDGRLTPTLLSSATAVQTDISSAWCNTPSTLTVEAEPLNQGASAPGYATPVGFSRLLTYDAILEGWPTAVSHRPLTGSAPSSTDAGEARSNPLTLSIASLQTLNADGTAEVADLVIEAGSYSGSIEISVSVQ